MFERSRLSLTMGVLAAILGAGVGSAGAQDNGPRTDAVIATFSGSPVNVRQRTCEGQDGTYLEIRGLSTGEIASSDPRLSGDLEYTAEPARLNLTTGLGTFRGRFRVVDPDTGALKAEGEFHTVITEGRLNHGLALGKVANPRPGAADNFVATFKSTFDAEFNVTGQLGGAGDPRTPAVVQGGHCRGAFVKVP